MCIHAWGWYFKPYRFAEILFEAEGSEDVGVMVCGPKKMRHEVAKICSSGLAKNLHFEAISFNWWSIPCSNYICLLFFIIFIVITVDIRWFAFQLFFSSFVGKLIIITMKLFFEINFSMSI